MEGRRRGVEDFLNHRTQERSGGYLKNWKDRGRITVWLHMAHVPEAVWFHPFPKFQIEEKKDAGTSIKHVYSEDYICHEAEALLKKQYFRNKETGERKFPPHQCGMCRLVEWVWQEVNNGRLPLSTPLFKFQGDVADETRIIHAGGFCGEFKGQKLNDAEKAELAQKGIRLDKAWNESAFAKAGYLAVVVDDASPGDGASITKFTAGLGDKIKTIIADEMDKAVEKKLLKAAGDPFENPYAFVLTYKKDEPPATMYSARRSETPLSDAVRSVIEGDEIDLSRAREPFNQKSMRALLERTCILPKNQQPNWDEIFAVGEYGGGDADESGSEDNDSFPPRDEAPSRGASAQQPPPAPTAPSAQPQEFGPCTVCPELGLGSDNWSTDPNSCPVCHSAFDDAGNVTRRGGEPPPPPPAGRRRRTAAGAKGPGY